MLQLDLKSRKSIYEQVVDGIKELVLAGVYKADDKLPSVRELSQELTVNPNTIQKAYRALEQQGWIYTVSGLGCFVAKSEHTADRAKTDAIYAQIRALVRELSYLGVDEGEIANEMQKVILERGRSK